MSRNRDIQRQLSDAGDRVSDRARYYADSASEKAGSLAKRGWRFGSRLGGKNYKRQMSVAAEDFADEANYQYRRLRRHVNRHPAATIAIVAGTVGAFVLLYRALASDSDD